MPTVKFENGKAAIVEDAFACVEDDQAIPTEGAVCVSLERFKSERDAILARNGDIGVRLVPQDDALELTDVIDRLSLVEVTFPKYTDGRAFSQAQLLRRRLQFKGEVRAVGQVLRDQMDQMARCGIDGFVFEPTSGDAPDVVEEAIADFTYAYQRTSGAQTPIFARRHAVLNKE